MKMLRFLLFFLVLMVVFFFGSAYAQEDYAIDDFNIYKDPFDSLLPRSDTGGIDAPNLGGGDGDLGPPPITIEGVLWGTNKPLTLIDGQVYAVGEVVTGVGAKVFKIRDNIVFISYGEKIYEMSVQNKEGM